MIDTDKITTSEIVANFRLPPILVDLRLAEPDIQVEIVASDTDRNLLRRDADIAARIRSVAYFLAASIDELLRVA